MLRLSMSGLVNDLPEQIHRALLEGLCRTDSKADRRVEHRVQAVENWGFDLV